MRTLRRSPGFTVITIAILALGIATVTGIFSVVNKVLLEPLPYPDPDRLVQLVTKSQRGDQNVVSIPKYVIWRDATTVFQCMAAYEVGGPASLVKDNASGSGMGFRRNRDRSALVITEMALALVLLVGAGLLIRTFVARRTISRGFDEQNVHVGDIAQPVAV